jgi:hypothetical protein
MTAWLLMTARLEAVAAGRHRAPATAVRLASVDQETACIPRRSRTAAICSPTVEIEGHEILYWEIRPVDAPILLLLQGFPTASRMFRELIPMLATSTTWSRRTTEAESSRLTSPISGDSGPGCSCRRSLMTLASLVGTARRRGVVAGPFTAGVEVAGECGVALGRRSRAGGFRVVVVPG